MWNLGSCTKNLPGDAIKIAEFEGYEILGFAGNALYSKRIISFMTKGNDTL
jgi:hypothetical protein